jgi:Tfp pilus assembly protein PilO
VALNQRERKLLIAIITIVVVGVNYLLASELAGRWKPLRSDLDSKRRTLEGMQAEIARKPEWQKKFDDLKHNLKQSQTFETANDVSRKIQEVGGAAGILIQSSRPLKEESKDVYRELPVQCQFEADTVSLVKFLWGLQSASGFMTVETLSVAAKSDASSVLRCDIQVRALASTVEKQRS